MGEPSTPTRGGALSLGGLKGERLWIRYPWGDAVVTTLFHRTVLSVLFEKTLFLGESSWGKESVLRDYFPFRKRITACSSIKSVLGGKESPLSEDLYLSAVLSFILLPDLPSVRRGTSLQGQVGFLGSTPVLPTGKNTRRSCLLPACGRRSLNS